MDLSSPSVQAAFSTMGWPGPRPHQVSILEAVLEHQGDVAVVLSTGGGKSALYQIPAIARPGCALVISPLIALMIDQVSTLREAGVRAFTLNSNISDSEKRECRNAVQAGEVDLLYVSPERLFNLDRRFFENLPVNLIAVDEAHCISEWGYDFRPSYRRIPAALRRLFPPGERPQTIALTATATDHVFEDICQSLDLKERIFRGDPSGEVLPVPKDPDSYTHVFRGTTNRDNIFIGVVPRHLSVEDMLRRAAQEGFPILVYGSTRLSVETAASEARAMGFSADFYHAGRSKDERWAVQAAFAKGRIEVLAATNAFGMGVDGTIRSVVHLNMPTSLESFAQEMGRAGRDDKPALNIVRPTLEALEVAQSFVQITWPLFRDVAYVWTRMRTWFERGKRTSRPEGPGRMHRSLSWISEHILRGAYRSFSPDEVGSCVRLLVGAGHLKRIGYSELPVKVVLNQRRHELTGVRQLHVIANLELYANANMVVEGTVAFFRDCIGMDQEYAKALSARDAIRIEDWGKRESILELVDNSRECKVDPDLLQLIRQRQFVRIGHADSFLKNKAKCRRRYLLRYFAASGQIGGPHCCDLCNNSKRPPEWFDGRVDP